ncbi:hypothetical protein N7478_011697 [Penicillium angulare]|uniref:uncharacterized protein n=1 Tax=Penicillium angulare TaxID=116970 RepID=UPI00253FF58A|nr:uncharacterized protein N7478_011697 [Penicillium angulare]KAJ5261102.1 hypothetical protein N7478_011697 [Penicillium angulare]
MNSLSKIVILMAASTVTAIPSGGGTSQCTTEQANKCCTGLTDGILNIEILPALCLPLVGSCNNQAACCETNGVGLLNCLTVQV